MKTADIEKRASFDYIRYAQLWEDADVLLKALGEQKGKTLVSICSAGDNALAMLLLDPAKVVAIDLSMAQIACLEIRIAAYKTLEYSEFLEIMGVKDSIRRKEILEQLILQLDKKTAEFWRAKIEIVETYGLCGIGKFERYFHIFRKWMLPLAQSRSTIEGVFEAKSKTERKKFFDKRWNNWRWRLLLKIFFSNFVMGQLGRDPAFFDHVEGSLSDHVGRRIYHAGVDLEPEKNPYLQYILLGKFETALPLAWREESFNIIKGRLDRIEYRCGSFETFVSTGESADGFNLSDIFEYMDEEVFNEVYGSIIKAANPRAKLVYWNMMVPRRVPRKFSEQVIQLKTTEEECKAMDKAFFYSDFVVEEVL